MALRARGRKIDNFDDKSLAAWSQKGTIIDHFGARNEPFIGICNFHDEMRLSRSLRQLKLLRLLRSLRLQKL